MSTWHRYKVIVAIVILNLFAFWNVIAEGLDVSQDIEFKSDYDQTSQRYIVRLPVGFDKLAEYDVLIALHGHGSDRWQFARSVDWQECIAVRDFAGQKGMILVSPDYRAATSWMGPAAEADVVQIIGEIKTGYKVKRIFLCGVSMGGSSTLTFAVLHPELIAGATAMNPTANHIEYDNFQDAIIASFGGTKKDIPAEYKKRSAEYWPEKVSFPLSISVGSNDPTVPPDSAVRFAGILQKLGKNVLLVNRPEMGHKTSYDDCKKILQFVLDAADKKDEPVEP